VAVYTPDRDSSYTNAFKLHGAEGLDEGAFQAWSQAERQRLTDEFWKSKQESLGDKKLAEQRAELQKDLDKDLKWNERGWFAAQKAGALLPSARLGAVLGRFTPDQPATNPAKPSTTAGTNAPPPDPKPLYFRVGPGAEFTAPAWGTIDLVLNVSPTNRLPEDLVQLLTRTEVLKGAASADAAPGFGVPEWQRKGDGAFAGNRWQLHQKVLGWAPQPHESLDLFCAPSEEGPWFPLGTRSSTNNPVAFDRNELDVGLWGVLRTRLRFGSDYSVKGEVWSPPVRIARQPEPLVIDADGGWASICGRRGQQVQIQVTGKWDPVRFEGIPAYGPEGMPEAVFQQRIQGLVKAEQDLTEQQKASNQDNLLGLVMETPGGPRQPPQGGLKDVDYFLGRKGSLASQDLPAGSLLAAFVRGLSSETRWAKPDPFAPPSVFGAAEMQMVVGRTWGFTFPQDGRLSFYPNRSHGWTGSHYVQGTGALTLNVTLTDPPQETDQAGTSDQWSPPPMPAPDWPTLPATQPQSLPAPSPPILAPPVTRPADS